MLGFVSFSLLRCKGSENQASTDRTPSKMKTPPTKNFFPCMSGMSLCPAFRHRLRSLWHSFSHWKFVLKNPCQQLCFFSRRSLPTKLCMSHSPGLANRLAGLGRAIFSGRSHWWNLSWKPVPTALLLSKSLLPNGALPKLFPTVSRPSTLSCFHQAIFPTEFPFRPPCRRFTASLLPTKGALPKLFPTVSPPSTLPSLPYRSLRGKGN